MSGIQQKDPKKKIKRCEVSGCSKAATGQVLGVRNVPVRFSHELHVFDVCDSHFEEKHDSELEETYLRTYESLGKFGIKELDSFFEKKLVKKT